MATSSFSSAHGGELRELLVSSREERRAALREAHKAPRLILTPRQRCDLELLLVGGFSPLRGFMDERDYRSVLERMRLTDGLLWPMPIVFDVSKATPYQPGDTLLLTEEDGTPLATMHVSARFEPNKRAEAIAVFGTESEEHPGVASLMRETGDVYLGGMVRGLTLPNHNDFLDLRLTPLEIRARFAHAPQLIGFQTRNPLHRAHVELIRRAAHENGARVLIHPVVGITKPGDVEYRTRVRCYRALLAHYIGDIADLALLPLAMRMAGPREALWHAIIRKNYGCTHFIVGRDHAGPGKDSSGTPFYPAYAAQELVVSHAEELGIRAVPFQEMVYIEESNSYVPQDEVRPGQSVRSLSGTEVRRMLETGEDIPSWFSYPEIVAELRSHATRARERGFTIFFTGLSGAGKSTLARLLASRIESEYGRAVTLLDGDVVRTHLSRGLGFSREDRIENIARIGFVAAAIVRHGGIAICAAIAPYEEARERARQLVESADAFIEVYVATPLAICRARDTKGLYTRAETGELPAFTGISDPYEVPTSPEITLDTSTENVSVSVATIEAYVTERGLLKADLSHTHDTP